MEIRPNGMLSNIKPNFSSVQPTDNEQPQVSQDTVTISKNNAKTGDISNPAFEYKMMRERDDMLAREMNYRTEIEMEDRRRGRF